MSDTNEIKTKVNDLLASLPALPQRQDSTKQQLSDLRMVANRLGMHDAAGAIRQLFEIDGSLETLRYGCHCDLEPHMEPDGCVIDEGRHSDCNHAKTGMRKEQCEYWRICGS